MFEKDGDNFILTLYISLVAGIMFKYEMKNGHILSPVHVMLFVCTVYVSPFYPEKKDFCYFVSHAVPCLKMCCVK